MSNSSQHHGLQHARPSILHNLQKFAQVHAHCIGDAIQPSHLFCPLLLQPSISPNIRDFSSESAVLIRWPECWSVSFNISPSNEYSTKTNLKIQLHCFSHIGGFALGSINYGGFLHSSVSKESACNARDPGSIPGLGRSLEGRNGNPLQYSCLENPMDWGAWEPTIHGVYKSRIWLSHSTNQPINYGDWENKACLEQYYSKIFPSLYTISQIARSLKYFLLWVRRKSKALLRNPNFNPYPWFGVALRLKPKFIDLCGCWEDPLEKG